MRFLNPDPDTWRIPGGPYTALGVAAVAFLILVIVRPGDSLDAGQSVEPAHFHHFHLNVTDPDSTLAFYQKFFGAYEVQYRDRSDALFTERSFILLDEVDEEPRTNVGTTLWHTGWAGVVPEAEFSWRREEGIEVQTPLTPLGDNAYMYFWGPDRELIEIYTGSRNHRFEHFHLMASNVDETVQWLQRHLGLRRTGSGSGPVQSVRIDNINMVITQIAGPDDPRPEWYPDTEYPVRKRGDLRRTDGTVIDHLAFAVPELEPTYDRMSDAGVEIVEPIRARDEHGHTSFFVRGPDGLLVEIVEDEPIPEAIWR